MSWFVVLKCLLDVLVIWSAGNRLIFGQVWSYLAESELSFNFRVWKSTFYRVHHDLQNISPTCKLRIDVELSVIARSCEFAKSFQRSHAETFELKLVSRLWLAPCGTWIPDGANQRPWKFNGHEYFSASRILKPLQSSWQASSSGHEQSNVLNVLKSLIFPPCP